jgi:hypothetical protein
MLITIIHTLIWLIKVHTISVIDTLYEEIQVDELDEEIQVVSSKRRNSNETATRIAAVTEIPMMKKLATQLAELRWHLRCDVHELTHEMNDVC